MDFVTHCRYQFLRDAVTMQKVHAQMTDVQVRHALNQSYGVFGIVGVSDPELDFALGLLHRIPPANGGAYATETTTVEDDSASPDDDDAPHEKGG